MKILLTVSYVGTSYCGYQLQGEKPTVALMLNRATKKAFGVECSVTGCSRTDKGVHALGFCATVEPKNKNEKITVPTDKIPISLNTVLPEDISVVSAVTVDDSFHPRYSVVKKEYVYKIHDSDVRDPFFNKKVLEYGRKIDDIGIEKMNIGAKYFVGTYDFRAFMSSGSKIVDTTRTVYESYFVRNGDVIEYHICANGFLYNMVRIIVGTLLNIEKGKINPENIPGIISSKSRNMAGDTAIADGLYLKKVYYNY